MINKMEELIKKLNSASDAYYNGQNEIMSNYEWDAMFDELKKLEEVTGVILPDSPTNNVSADETKGKKEVHEFPALSLAKTKNIADLAKWANGKPVWVSWKLDGLTIVATYSNGKLEKIVTRGDGHIGTNVTHLTDGIIGIPKEISYKGHLVVRGEAVISYTDFNAYVDETGADYANPRNLASGSFNLDDIEELKRRKVQWIPFSLIYTDENLPNSYESRIKWLKSLGFDFVKSYMATNENEIEFAIDDFTKALESGAMDIPVDGLVLAYEDWEYSQSGTVTGHHSTRGGYAFKWQDKAAESKLQYIEWSCATNVITPVAVFDPVELEGTTVTRASLCNISECKRLGIGAGSTVSVIKANMIIPKIIKASKGELNIPDTCPACRCKTEVKISELGTEVLTCTNPNCIAKNLSKLTRFVSKHGMNIDGMSEATLKTLINKGWINGYADIYKLKDHANEWKTLEGFGKKSVDKLLAAIEKSRTTEFAKFIYACSILNVGREQAKLLKSHLDSIYDECEEVLMSNGDGSYDLIGLLTQLVNVSSYDFTVIEGFGEVISKSVSTWVEDNLIFPYTLTMDEDATWDIINLLKELRFIDVRPNKNQHTSIACKGLTFVITGDVHHYKNRDELKAYIESCGGRVSGSVSSKTSYLINNDVNSTSGKNKKAKELGIEIISEDDFVKKFC